MMREPTNVAAPRAALALLAALAPRRLRRRPGGCAPMRTPMRPRPRAAGLDAIGTAAIGDIVALGPGNALGAERVIVLDAYRAASGRSCRRVARAVADGAEVVCLRADGHWTPTRSLGPRRVDPALNAVAVRPDAALEGPGGAPPPPATGPRLTPALVLGALVTQARVINALILRETKTRYGNHKIGFLWALIEPAVSVTVFVAIFAAFRQSQPGGMPLVPYMMVGILGFGIFRETWNRMQGAIESSRTLLAFPQVTTFDVILSRGLLESAIGLFTLGFLLYMAFLLGHDIRIERPLGAARGAGPAVGVRHGHGLPVREPVAAGAVGQPAHRPGARPAAVLQLGAVLPRRDAAAPGARSGCSTTRCCT